MGTQELEVVAVEYILDCSQPELCDCLSCSDTRRARVLAFCQRWFAAHPATCPYTDVEQEESGVRAAPTMPPPGRQRKVA